MIPYDWMSQGNVKKRMGKGIAPHLFPPFIFTLTDVVQIGYNLFKLNERNGTTIMLVLYIISPSPLHSLFLSPSPSRSLSNYRGNYVVSRFSHLCWCLTEFRLVSFGLTSVSTHHILY
uniref:Uncharacterized protein n=1 Tax=Cacopsylla melanoneura TaxID=428564 RepID=A0A8D8ZC38_9HEMI